MKRKKKSNGSYYTPVELTKFIIGYTIKNFSCTEPVNILEPSAGDGAFLRAILNHEPIERFTDVTVTLVEKDSVELEKALKNTPPENKKNSIRIHPHGMDFLDFITSDTSKYSLIVGNPPYIKKNYLTDHQVEMCGQVHQGAGLSKNRMKNIWSAFVVGCVNRLADDGILAFVLPSEFLQVKFAQEIRELLCKELERIEVFTFNQILFECNGQETVLVVGYKRSAEKGVFYTDIQDVKNLKKGKFTLKPNVSIQTTSTKWTHHFLSPDELDLIYKLKMQFKAVDDYCISKAGIVTAANNYFIVNEEVANEYGLQPYLKPIIQKGFFVNGRIVFKKEDFELLVKSGKPSFLLAMNGSPSGGSGKLDDYLNIGLEKEIDKRFKCQLRKRWFEVPNIGTPPAGFFFKRCHRYPKILKNDADVLVTDSAYKLEMRHEYSIDSFIYSFYNSLTIIFAELEGRYYGGGVLELTPNEFKKLPVPYVEMDSGKFHEFVKRFEADTEKDVLLYENDRGVLHSIYGINLKQIAKLSSIRKKLMNRRMRINQKKKTGAVRANVQTLW